LIACRWLAAHLFKRTMLFAPAYMCDPMWLIPSRVISYIRALLVVLFHTPYIIPSINSKHQLACMHAPVEKEPIVSPFTPNSVLEQ
jgi:hypothetical protein